MWQITRNDAGVFRYADTDTGEIRETRGGFDGLVRQYDEDEALLDRIAAALGPDVLNRWQNGEELDLAAEVAALRGTVDGYRRALADLLNVEGKR